MSHDIDGPVIHGQRDQIAELEKQLEAAYRERAFLVAHLAAIHPSRVAYSDPSTPEWLVVTIATPTGQMAWHIAPGDVDLFDGDATLDESSWEWDGHSTDEKYSRLRELTKLHRDGVPWA